ncbi:MAG: 4-hydroxythreonine-4-phosphate dehydrogenase PdxA [Lentisphaerae bacterium GWF2_44_16]|nr:MAG: 4-hydroxythreonine-4-phosphate dehydrogenase PdxA [Lentisphaerae bacterium GWF2_44_16]
MVKKNASFPVIALTMGDPAGIGPEIAVRAANDPEIKKLSRIIIYGCPDIIEEASKKFCEGKMPEIVSTGDLKFSEITIGKEDPKCGICARKAVIKAVKDTLAGTVDAIVTSPVNKASINIAGIPFTGHTELIADLCKTKNYAMMQSAGKLRVAFVTTHISLKEVCSNVTEERIIEVAELLYNEIKSENIAHPKLAAAALNPHAGENGYMGDEDKKTVRPALEKLHKMGVNIEGPFPPDTLFIEKTRDKFDGILCMYHDQGHIPFKMLAFDKGVNTTLGLPIIRTSPDHGTAFEIAWKGVAHTGSLFEAIRLAAKRVKKIKS